MTRGSVPSVAVAGVVLAAGAGRRFGRPKALVGGWLQDRVEALAAGGCTDVVVVLGAGAQDAMALVPEGALVRVAENWAAGLGASLRAALDAVEELDADAALIALVDVPGLSAQAVRRLVDVVNSAGTASGDVLAQAVYAGLPGHPVLLGRSHWPGARRSAVGDRGARDYLARHLPVLVECGDVADGSDVDHPGPGPAPVSAGAPGPWAAADVVGQAPRADLTDPPRERSCRAGV